MILFYFQTKASQKSSKSEKKDDFKGVYDLVLEAAGGDSENLKCRGEALGTNDSIKGHIFLHNLFS